MSYRATLRASSIRPPAQFGRTPGPGTGTATRSQARWWEAPGWPWYGKNYVGSSAREAPGLSAVDFCPLASWTGQLWQWRARLPSRSNGSISLDRRTQPTERLAQIVVLDVGERIGDP